MDVNNPLYKGQGIHVISAIFTVERGNIKVLLLKRKKEPFKDHWILAGGACYNNENIDDAIKREVIEKTGIYNILLEQFKAFGKPYRAPDLRMVAIGYIGVINSSEIKEHYESRNTSDVQWFDIKKLPRLGYDHEEILFEAIETLKKKIFESNILKALFDEYFTIAELQKAYEVILEKKFDRRNFKKKFLSMGLIVETKKEQTNKIGKPARLYQFNSSFKEDKIKSF